MAGYSPLKITGMTVGLVKNREEFILPDDAYPQLQNAYVWRERILRKKGYLLLGRLQRNLTAQSLGNTIVTGVSFNLFTQINRSGIVTAVTNANPGAVTTSVAHLLQTGQFVTFSGIVGMTQLNGHTYQLTVTGANTFTINVNTTAFGVFVVDPGATWTVNSLSTQTNKSIVPGTVVITMPGPIVFTDQGDGTFTSVPPGGSGNINYATGAITLNTAAGPGTSIVAFSYYPGLPVMGIRTRELTNSSNDETVFFDQVYAYVFDQGLASFREFIPGTTWNASGHPVSSVDFFWSTNYWVSSLFLPGTIPPDTIPFFTTANQKLFWVTNNTGAAGALADPIRITDGITWVDFVPPLFGQIDASPKYLVGCLSFLPFRGRMLAFNTYEGASLAQGVNFSNRIRWSTIGNPFIPFGVPAPGVPARGSWRDDIRGQGGFLDIPTSEDIVSVGFVRDNLVIYCERSTWQLRYTGRSIAPFQIEKVNSELGGDSPFSAVQFDTSLVGIGDKGIVECDSYKSERIDIKIPDFVFEFQNENNGPYRVHGVRNFINRLAFWTVPLADQYQGTLGTVDKIFPNTRLVYNYENDSWALFNDSLTTMGTYQPQSSRTWLNTHVPWIRANFSWISSQTKGVPSIVGGNQQGFIEYLDELTTNDVSLFISSITPNTTTPTVITSPNHNMVTNFVIQISGIPSGTPYSASLNDGIFGIVVTGPNTFQLWKYNATSGEFSDPQLDIPAGDYVGGGLIKIRENFSILSKKFNFLDEGMSIQFGYLDILMASTEPEKPGAISLNVYLNYDADSVSNTKPQNEINDYSPVSNPDTFFNSVIPTTQGTLSGIEGSKFWQRVYCPTSANFITIEYVFSNAQMAGEEQTKEVQIDAQVLWIRRGGRMVSV